VDASAHYTQYLVIHSYTPKVYAQPFIDFLRRHSGSLRRLLLNGVKFEDDESDEVPNGVGILAPNLERIYIHCSRGQVTENIFENIPKSAIEVSVDVGYDIDSPSSIAKCVRFLDSLRRTESRLRRLAVRMDAGQAIVQRISRDPWVEVEKVAAAQGVIFTCDHNRMDAGGWAVGHNGDRYPDWSKL
jgi:hypothetical protein